MCIYCCTFRQLHEDFIRALGIHGRFFTSLDSAWYLANTIVEEPHEDGDEEWFDTKKKLWDEGKLVKKRDLILPDKYWEIYPNHVVHGYRVYQLPDDFV